MDLPEKILSFLTRQRTQIIECQTNLISLRDFFPCLKDDKKPSKKEKKITRKNLHHTKPPIHLDPNSPCQWAQGEQMIFGFLTTPQLAQERCSPSKTTPLIDKLTYI
jgi:hypothetical protein